MWYDLWGMEMYCVDANVARNEKFLSFAFSLFLFTYFPSSGIRALYHMIYMLNVLIIASVVIMHVDICKSCEYGV